MSLTLFYRRTCPFCTKVLDALKDWKEEVSRKDLDENSAYASELIEIGGKRQVPCLVYTTDQDEKKALYESDAIVAWLENKQNKNESASRKDAL
ncbi:MAG: glutaredoxin [Chlamydiota bacterium]